LTEHPTILPFYSLLEKTVGQRTKQNKDVREVLVSNRFFRKECPAALSSEQCPSKTYEKICQDKGLFASLWGNCRCVGGLCPVGTTVCSRDCSVKKPCACVELRTDSKHCGQCENRCPQGAICQNGQCLCAKGTTLCKETKRCVDLQTNSQHCGRCGNVCAKGGVCFQGLCQEIPLSAGSYVRGSPDNEVDWKSYAEPPFSIPRIREIPHLVTLTRPFFLGKYEVTGEWFKKVTGYKPSSRLKKDFFGCKKEALAYCPAYNVTFFQAMDFCNQLSIQRGVEPCYNCVRSSTDKGDVNCAVKPEFIGRNIYRCKGYRLPTDAEWEYAARAGTTTPFYSGFKIRKPISLLDDYLKELGGIAWFTFNSNNHIHPTYVPAPRQGTQTPKEYKKPNAWGLYHMLGNVAEWVWDTNTLFTTNAVIDPCDEVGTDQRIIRGGNVFQFPLLVRSGARVLEDPQLKKNNTPLGSLSIPSGFRIARTFSNTNDNCSRTGFSFCGVSGCKNTRADTKHCGTCNNTCKAGQSCQRGRCQSGEVVVETKDSNGKPIVWTRGHMSTRFDSICSYKRKEDKVQFTYRFSMQVYEVTQRDFVQLSKGFNPSRFKTCERCPVDSATWFMALKYANLLSKARGYPQCYDCQGELSDENLYCSLKPQYRGNKGKDYVLCKGYRLPTESEWEFAALAGGKRKHNCRNFDPDRRLSLEAWTRHNSLNKTHPVGTLLPNDIGLFDMLGNVHEWTWDIFLPYSELPDKGNAAQVLINPVSPYKQVSKECMQCFPRWDARLKGCSTCFRVGRSSPFDDALKLDEALRYAFHVQKVRKNYEGNPRNATQGFRLVRTVP
jgi:formylglycine-generating enzyme required for sulfatase activity